MSRLLCLQFHFFRQIVAGAYRDGRQVLFYFYCANPTPSRL